MQKIIFYLAVFALLGSCARPMANFSVPAEDIPAAKTFTFNNETEKAQTYLWDFGDGTTSNLQNPSVVFNNLGTYTVKLVASNAQGNDSITKTAYITVASCNNIEVDINTDNYGYETSWELTGNNGTTVYDTGGTGGIYGNNS